MGLGNTQRSTLLDSLLAGTTYMSLHTGAPGADGQAGNEATGTGYAAKSVASGDWAAATVADPSVKANDTQIVFTAAAGGTWSGGSNLSHFGLWGHVSNRAAADFIGWGPLAVAQPVMAGNPVTFEIGDLVLNLADAD
jgi:hypothetical protein